MSRLGRSELAIKVLVVGEPGCGKSSLIYRFVTKTLPAVDELARVMPHALSAHYSVPMGHASLNVFDAEVRARVCVRV